MLGSKALDCFVWSAAHDTDAEFLRRYAGSPERVAVMRSLHRDEPLATEALARLARLVP